MIVVVVVVTIWLFHVFTLLFFLNLLLEFLLVLFGLFHVKFVLIDTLLQPFQVPGFVLLQK